MNKPHLEVAPTLTLAQIYASQGQWYYALAICEQLLEYKNSDEVVEKTEQILKKIYDEMDIEKLKINSFLAFEDLIRYKILPKEKYALYLDAVKQLKAEEVFDELEDKKEDKNKSIQLENAIHTTDEVSVNSEKEVEDNDVFDIEETPPNEPEVDGEPLEFEAAEAEDNADFLTDDLGSEKGQNESDFIFDDVEETPTNEPEVDGEPLEFEAAEAEDNADFLTDDLDSEKGQNENDFIFDDVEEMPTSEPEVDGEPLEFEETSEDEDGFVFDDIDQKYDIDGLDDTSSVFANNEDEDLIQDDLLKDIEAQFKKKKIEPTIEEDEITDDLKYDMEDDLDADYVQAEDLFFEAGNTEIEEVQKNRKKESLLENNNTNAIIRNSLFNLTVGELIAKLESLETNKKLSDLTLKEMFSLFL